MLPEAALHWRSYPFQRIILVLIGHKISDFTRMRCDAFKDIFRQMLPNSQMLAAE